MLRAVQEDALDEEAPGSILNLCQGLVQNAGTVAELSQLSNGSQQQADEQLEILQLRARQASEALTQCQERFRTKAGTVQKAEALLGEVQGLQQSAIELQRRRRAGGAAQGQQPNGFCACFASPRLATAGSAGLQKFEEAKESLRKTMEILRAVDTAGEDRFIFGSWQPESVSRDDPFYKRPVAFDTVTGYLLAPKLPARILVHGSSGNGKTSLMRQLLAAIRNEDHPLHAELTARFSGGLKWVECGFGLRGSNRTFAADLRQKAAALAQELLPLDDERLLHLDDVDLASVIRERISDGSFLVVFEDVWDGDIFRRDFLDVLPDEPRQGGSRKGTIIVTSQFNLSSMCQWHSPETITVPLAADSNMNACLSLLASLWAEDPTVEDVPELLQPIARKLVKECGGSPLAVRLVAPLLEGSSKERKWKEVQAGMVAVAQLPHRLDAKGEVNEELPRALSAFELRARTLPKAVRQLVSVVMLFPPSKQIPVPAFLAIAAVCTDRPLDECAMLLQELASAFFVEVRGPSRRLNTGTACYHKLLKQFLITSPDYRAIQLPGKATESTSLALALVVLYATPAYHQQAAQVFSKLPEGKDSQAWEQPPANRRSPVHEPFWTSLLALTADPELGFAAKVPVISAARQVVSLQEISNALCVLFADPRALLAAAGVFSELAWQMGDPGFLRSVAEQLESVQAVGRLVIRLRELTSLEGGTIAQAEEVTVLAWALADMAEHISPSARRKLASEPVIAALRTHYQGAAIYAYNRLRETLGLR